MIYQVSLHTDSRKRHPAIHIAHACTCLRMHLCMHKSRDIRFTRYLLMVYWVSFNGILGLFFGYTRSLLMVYKVSFNGIIGLFYGILGLFLWYNRSLFVLQQVSFCGIIGLFYISLRHLCMNGSHLSVCVCVCVHTYIHAYIFAQPPALDTGTPIQTHTYRQTQTDTPIQTHSYRRTHTDKHIQTHPYRHTHTDAPTHA